MKIITVVGARPQFIKAAAVSRVLRQTPGVGEVLVHTGQHYDENMSRVFFDELMIPEPDYHLGIGSGNHGAQTGRMLEAIEQVLMGEKPDWVLVYGDTNSTLAGALAAVKLQVPIAHVEAGLRSFNRKMPEEINRVLTDHAANLLFAPTETAVANLRHEGIADNRVRLVGDVMYDAALFYAEREANSRVLEVLGIEPRGYVLATVHRAENTDDPERLRAIFEGLAQVAEQLPVVLPLHPRTRKALEREGLLEQMTRSLHLIKPVGYLEIIALEKNARIIATDSGGVQKEAYFHRVPCVTLRDETEWVELVETGWNRLVAPREPVGIARAIMQNLDTRGREVGLYGGGQSAEKIVEILLGS